MLSSIHVIDVYYLTTDCAFYYNIFYYNVFKSLYRKSMYFSKFRSDLWATRLLNIQVLLPGYLKCFIKFADSTSLKLWFMYFDSNYHISKLKQSAYMKFICKLGKMQFPLNRINVTQPYRTFANVWFEIRMQHRSVSRIMFSSLHIPLRLAF